MIMKKNRSIVAAISMMMLSVLWVGSAKADIVYTNYASAALNNNAGLAIDGENNGLGFQYQSVATGFTSGGNYSLNSISIPLFGATGCTSFNCPIDGVDISLWTSSGGLLDSSIGNWYLSTPINGVNTISVSGVALVSGANYFLKLDAQSSDAALGWMFNTQDIQSPLLIDHNVGFCADCFPAQSTNTGGAFELDGTVSSVPEPGIYQLMLFGLVIVVWFGKRKRNNVGRSNASATC